MNKTNQFSPKAQYVTPSCKSVELQARDVILQGSNGTNESFNQRSWIGGFEEEED